MNPEFLKTEMLDQGSPNADPGRDHRREDHPLNPKVAPVSTVGCSFKWDSEEQCLAKLDPII